MHLILSISSKLGHVVTLVVDRVGSGCFPRSYMGSKRMRRVSTLHMACVNPCSSLTGRWEVLNTGWGSKQAWSGLTHPHNTGTTHAWQPHFPTKSLIRMWFQTHWERYILDYLCDRGVCKSEHIRSREWWFCHRWKHTEGGRLLSIHEHQALLPGMAIFDPCSHYQSVMLPGSKTIAVHPCWPQRHPHTETAQ